MSNPCRVWITNTIQPTASQIWNCVQAARRYCKPYGIAVWSNCETLMEVSRATTGPVCVITKKCMNMLYSCSGFDVGSPTSCYY
jgi:hypothetical protein